jgi:hypothetical protein
MGRNERIQIESVPKLFDVVELLSDRAGLAAGARGTVVEELPGDSYLVEFSNEDGKSLSVETLSAAEIALHR